VGCRFLNCTMLDTHNVLTLHSPLLAGLLACVMMMMLADTILPLAGGRLVSWPSSRFVLHAYYRSLSYDPAGNHSGHLSQDQVSWTSAIIHDGTAAPPHTWIHILLLYYCIICAWHADEFVS
jgi:hypothetical protein